VRFEVVARVENESRDPTLISHRRPGDRVAVNHQCIPKIRESPRILLTVRRGIALCSTHDARTFAMIETVTALLGLMSVGIFLAHSFEGFRSGT